MRWDQGRDVIEAMLTGARPALQAVKPSREHADRLLEQARAHLGSAAQLADTDPEGAYALLYDAARKALTAILENQGLRPTSAGSHLAAYDATLAQLDPPMGKLIRPFDRMRRARRDAEYPPTDAEQITAKNVTDDLPKATAIVDMTQTILDQMSPY